MSMSVGSALATAGQVTEDGSNGWVYVLVTLGIVAVVGSAAFFIGFRSRPAGTSQPAAARRRNTGGMVNTGRPLVRKNGRILWHAPEERSVLAVFMDFDSGTCRAARPFIDELIGQFGNRITFVIAHFPQHDAATAARAIEAAAQQGRFREMFDIVCTPGAEPVKRVSSDSLRGRAKDIGLNMQQFDVAVSKPATAEKIRSDKAYGASLGVATTPTFILLDGEKLAARSPEEFKQMLAAAAGGG